MIALACALLLLAAVPVQDDLEGDIKELSAKISKDGLSGRLAQAAATPSGAQAIKEKIDFLLAARTSRLERDPLGHYEDYLFAADANGDLRLRAERKDEMQRLASRMAGAAESMKDFHRRCDEIVRQMGERGELDKRAKKAWSDPA